MDSIQSKIEALTQELKPYPKGEVFYTFDPQSRETIMQHGLHAQSLVPQTHRIYWDFAVFASTNKAEVEEYADCYKRLKLYQLLGKQKEKEYPITWAMPTEKYATDFESGLSTGRVQQYNKRVVVLGGVWFSREEDRLEALKICGIDAEFQKRCSKYGLGGT